MRRSFHPARRPRRRWVATLTLAVRSPAGTVTVRVTGSVSVKSPSPSSLSATSTASPPSGAGVETLTVNEAVSPSVMGVRSAVIVTAGRSASCTTTSAVPGSPTV